MNKKHIFSLSGKVLLSFAFMLFSAYYVNAQKTITGNVSNAENGEPLIGATIQLETNMNHGTVTDLDGNFTFKASVGDVLIVSYVGYKTQSISVTEEDNYKIVMELGMAGLQDVVIIGYGSQKKEDLTGSVVAIGTEDFNKGLISTPTNLISGKVAGVQITTNGGAPGEGATIRIRGGSSLSASNDPLYVIDGIPLDGGSFDGMRNPLNMINPNDIASMTVLKDASATAIYGSRASNGVIIITTKKGKLNSPLKVAYTANVSISQVNKRIDVLDAGEFTNYVTEHYPDQVDMLGTANTNWQDQIYTTAIGTEHNLSFSGAIKKLPYLLSLGYNTQNGILKTDEMERTSIALNLNPSLFNDHLKVNLNGKFSNINNRFANRGAIGAALQYDPTKPIYNDGETITVNYTDAEGNPASIDTDYGGYWAWLQESGAPIEQGNANPLALLEQRTDLSEVSRFIGGAQFDYKFHFLPELRANLNLAYDYFESSGTVNVPLSAAFAFDPLNGGGSDNFYSHEKKNELLDFYLNYKKKIGVNDIDLMAGYSWQHFYRAGESVNQNIAKTIVDSSDYASENYLVSFFGRLNYQLMDKYLLTLTLRNDGSSRFSPDTRWGLFPSAAFAWNISEEKAVKDLDIFSQLKLRLGYGVTGQQNITDNDYAYLPLYTYSEIDASYLLGDTYFITLRPEAYDENIKWEETTTYNIGLDYGFANDRFVGSIEYYEKYTNDLINFIPIPAGTNLSNYVLTNVGDMENKGVEFALTSRIISKEDLFWQVGLNATHNKNEITKLTATDDKDYLGVFTTGISGGVGSTIQIHSVGQPANSFYVYEQVYDTEGMPIPGLYVDRNKDGSITDADRYHYHKPTADWMFGISSDFQYKDWTFSFAGRANLGNYVYNNVNSENAVYERLYRPEGPYLGNIVSAVTETEFETPHYLSDYYIEHAAFFRMDNISLAYQFEDLFKKGINLNLSATVNNAFVITEYEGIDPEIFNGVDNRIYPRPRTFVLGLNLNF